MLLLRLLHSLVLLHVTHAHQYALMHRENTSQQRVQGDSVLRWFLEIVGDYGIDYGVCKSDLLMYCIDSKQYCTCPAVRCGSFASDPRWTLCAQRQLRRVHLRSTACKVLEQEMHPSSFEFRRHFEARIWTRTASQIIMKNTVSRSAGVSIDRSKAMLHHCLHMNSY